MALDDLKERTKALDIAVGQIEKQFGKGSIMRLGQRGAIAPMEAISTAKVGSADPQFAAPKGPGQAYTLDQVLSFATGSLKGAVTVTVRVPEFAKLAQHVGVLRRMSEDGN